MFLHGLPAAARRWRGAGRATRPARVVSRLLRLIATGVGVLLGGLAVVAAPAVALPGAAIAVVVGAAVAMNTDRLVPTAPPAPPAATAGRWEAGIRAAGIGLAGWLVLVGVVLVLGAASVAPVLIALVVAAVWWWRRRGTPAGGTPRPVPGAAGTAPGPGPARQPDPVALPSPAAARRLSTAELCVAWRRSYVVMFGLPPGPGRCEIARVRHALLDELERRDPAGFTRWLEAGARAGSDPYRYLGTGR